MIELTSIIEQVETGIGLYKGKKDLLDEVRAVIEDFNKKIASLLVEDARICNINLTPTGDYLNTGVAIIVEKKETFLLYRYKSPRRNELNIYINDTLIETIGEAKIKLLQALADPYVGQFISKYKKVN